MGKGTFDEIGSTRVTLQWFSLMVLSSQVVGVIAIILLAVLFGQYRGGFGWVRCFFLSYYLFRYFLILVGY
jgi:cation transporter-like permease